MGGGARSREGQGPSEVGLSAKLKLELHPQCNGEELKTWMVSDAI